jgi:hypothetical protein
VELTLVKEKITATFRLFLLVHWAMGKIALIRPVSFASIHWFASKKSDMKNDGV